MLEIREGQQIRDFLARPDVNSSLESGSLIRLTQILKEWGRLETLLINAAKSYFSWNDAVAREEARQVMPLGPATRGSISRILPHRFPEISGPLAQQFGGVWAGQTGQTHTPFQGRWGINKTTGELEQVSERDSPPTEGEAWEYIDTISEQKSPDGELQIPSLFVSIKHSKLNATATTKGPIQDIIFAWRKKATGQGVYEIFKLTAVKVVDSQAIDQLPEALFGYTYEVAAIPVFFGQQITAATATTEVEVYGVSPEIRLEMRVEMLKRIHVAGLLRILRKGYTRKGAKILHNIQAVRQAIRARLEVPLKKLWLDRHTTVQRGVAWSTVNPPVESYMSTLLNRPGGDSHPDLYRLTREIRQLESQWKSGELHAGVVIADNVWMPNFDLGGPARL